MRGGERGLAGWLAGWVRLIISDDCVYRDQVCSALACVPQPGVCNSQVCHGQVAARVWAACLDIMCEM